MTDSHPGSQPLSDRQFNNADSFAHAFDEAWKSHPARSGEGVTDRQEKLDRILDALGDHPFALTDPAMARQVAEFRLRLLGL